MNRSDLIIRKKVRKSEKSRQSAENNLIRGIQEGKESSLNLLYQSYAPALLGVAKNILGDIRLAEEVLQDSFVKIWKYIHQYDPERGALFTWMINIVRFGAIDKLRSKEISQISKTDRLENFVGVIDQHKKEDSKEDDIGVQDILKTLGEPEKTILYKLYFGGYSQSEVSEAMDIPLGTVKTKVRSAMKILRKYLGDK